MGVDFGGRVNRSQQLFPSQAFWMRGQGWLWGSPNTGWAVFWGAWRVLREMHVRGAWVALGCPCSPVKDFVCGVPESAGSGWLLCPAQPLIYPWPGEGRAPGSSVCPAKCVRDCWREHWDMGSSECMCPAGRAQSELLIWNPFPVELGLEQGLSPGSNMFCQHSQSQRDFC